MSFRSWSLFTGRHKQPTVKPVTSARPGYRKPSVRVPVMVPVSDVRQSVYLAPRGSYALGVLHTLIPPVGYLQ